MHCLLEEHKWRASTAAVALTEEQHLESLEAMHVGDVRAHIEIVRSCFFSIHCAAKDWINEKCMRDWQSPEPGQVYLLWEHEDPTPWGWANFDSYHSVGLLCTVGGNHMHRACLALQ